MPYKDPEKRKEYIKQYVKGYRLIPEKRELMRINAKNSRMRHPESVRIRKRRWYKKHQGERKFYHQKYVKKIRMEVLTHYSNGEMKCACCDERTYAFLTLNHIDGGGGKERKQKGAFGLFTYLIRNNFPEGYNVLCYNCNCSQAFSSVCPHKL